MTSAGAITRGAAQLARILVKRPAPPVVPQPWPATIPQARPATQPLVLEELIEGDPIWPHLDL